MYCFFLSKKGSKTKDLHLYLDIDQKFFDTEYLQCFVKFINDIVFLYFQDITLTRRIVGKKGRGKVARHFLAREGRGKVGRQLPNKLV